MPSIFHFTKLETALEYILPTMQLRTNSLSNMNDPKESQPWAFGSVNVYPENLYPESYSSDTHIDHQFRLGSEIKDSSQIICFVNDGPEKGFLNEIMWAHYAQNHRGICLELDTDKFIDENHHHLGDYKFDSVFYGKLEAPYIRGNPTLKKEELISTFIRSNYKYLFFRKSKYWEHENEKRLVIFNRQQKYLSIKNALIGIYFGLSMPYSYRPSIDRYINETQTKIYDLYYESNIIKTMDREKNDLRPPITRRF